MSTIRNAGPSTAQGPGAPLAGWRVPAALAFAVASLPLAFWYGYGTLAAIVSLVLVWPAWRVGQRSALVWAAVAVGAAGVILGGFMLIAAVGLCGPGVLAGRCDA